MLFIIIFPFILWKNIMRLQYVQSVGYINYTLNKEDLKLPFFLTGVGWIFNGVFWALLISSGKRKNTKLLWCLFLIVSLVDSVKGNRAAFATNFVFFIYYIIHRYDINLNKAYKYLGVSFFVFFIFYFVSTNFRGSRNYQFDFFDSLIVGLFYNQSVSLNVPLLYMDFFNQIKNPHIPLILSDFLTYGFDLPVYSTTEMFRDFMFHQEGYGLGYVFLIELFELNVFAIPICFLLGKFIKFVEKNYFRNDYLVGLFSLFFMSIVYMPRHIILGVSPIRVSWVIFGLFLVISVQFFIKRGKLNAR